MLKEYLSRTSQECNRRSSEVFRAGGTLLYVEALIYSTSYSTLCYSIPAVPFLSLGFCTYSLPLPLTRQWWRTSYINTMHK